MGIFTRRGFEFLVRFDKLANVNIEKLKNELMKKFPGAKVDVLTSIQAISIIDQSKTDAREDVKDHFVEFGWYDVARVSTTYAV
mmetsp:Transcript_45866/g.74838  ORF Transcript_45866/g.74838 Transcript_45866/m.74838 type:complete len:84 (+) Transcript_45866:359-610(+)